MKSWITWDETTEFEHFQLSQMKMMMNRQNHRPNSHHENQSKLRLTSLRHHYSP